MGTEEPQVGGRIRRLRRLRHMAQADLAGRLGISSSYLNLIEHNRRPITVPLLLRVAGFFGIEPGELAKGDDAQLAGDLMELFGDPVFADADLTNQDIGDFAQSSPAVARAVMRLFDGYRRLSRHAEATPGGHEDVGGFHHATEAISDFLQDSANHFPGLETAAERARADIDAGGENFDYGLRSWLQNVFGLESRLASLPHGIALRRTPDGRAIEISDALPTQSTRFAIAHHLAPLVANAQIDEIIAAANLPEGDAPALARNVLGSYFAAALIMPYAPFLRACRDYRYDIDRLALRFGASFEQVCHRMTTLQRPGASGIPMHLIRTDIAGNISKRLSLSGIHIPRHTGACPRWNVYSAFLQPGRTIVQLSQMPSGENFFCIARSFEKGGHRHNTPRRHFSIGLGCDIAYAQDLVYSDGIDLTNTAQIVPIGVSCQICPRLECGQRAHPPARHRFHFEDGVMPETLYGRMS